jgi:hypothetical protein
MDMDEDDAFLYGDAVDETPSNDQTKAGKSAGAGASTSGQAGAQAPSDAGAAAGSGAGGKGGAAAGLSDAMAA